MGLRLAFLLHLRWEGDICSRWLCVCVHDFFVQFTDNVTGSWGRAVRVALLGWGVGDLWVCLRGPAST